MKESIGYTVTLNIAIMFIIIIFALIAMALSYYKAYKVGNVITHAIEKYEGYNSFSENEIESKLSSLGYNKAPNNDCPQQKGDCVLVPKGTNNTQYSQGENGYCVYLCMYDEDPDDDSDNYFHYKTETNMMWNIPIINSILNIPVENNTKKMFEFGAWEDWQEFISDCQSRNGTIQNNSCKCTGEGREWNNNKCECTGGKEWNGSSCQCPTNKPNWNGSSCVAACTGGKQWNGSSCQCPTSKPNWNGSSCVAACTGGKIWNGSSCQCPTSKPNWNYQTNSCVAACTGGKVWNLYNSCECPYEKPVWYNNKCISYCEYDCTTIYNGTFFSNSYGSGCSYWDTSGYSASQGYFECDWY